MRVESKELINLVKEGEGWMKKKVLMEHATDPTSRLDILQHSSTEHSKEWAPHSEDRSDSFK